MSKFIVAGVIAVDVENAASTIDRLGGGEHQIRRRRREHLAARGAVGKVLADKAGKHGLVAAAAADQQGHLVVGDLRANDGVPAFQADQPAIARKRQAVQQLGDDAGRVVQDLFRPIHSIDSCLARRSRQTGR
jgi:hypothetical protein